MPPPVAPASSPNIVGSPIAGLVQQLASAVGMKGLKAPASTTDPDNPWGSDPYANDEPLMELFKKLKKDAYADRWVYERVWWRNLLYLLGRQWIYYDQRRGQWLDKRMARWIPRPVTNKIAETTEAIGSVFAAVQLQSRARPNGNDPTNVTTAETADLLEPALAEEHGINELMTMESDFWFIVTGNAFVHVWWDKRAERGMFQVQYEQCATCGEASLPADVEDAGGVCPHCGGEIMTAAVDPETGEPKMHTITQGRGATDIISPFEIAPEPNISRFQDVSYLFRQRWRSKYWCERHLPKEVVAKLQWETLPAERSLQLLKSMAQQSDVGAQPLQFGGSDGGAQEDGITEYELWAKPSKDFPGGLFMRVLGEDGVILRDETESTPGPLPNKDQDDQPIFPFAHAPYQKIGGRLWGRSPLEDVIQKQDQLNQLDSMTQLTIQRMSNPIWLEPKGSEVKKFTGEPGLVVRYTPVMSGGMAKPEKIEGSNVPMSLIQIRDQILTDIELSAGTFDIIKGAKPTGVEAFSALQLLVERSQSRFAKPLKCRGEIYRKWYELALELERQFGPDERTWSMLGPNQAWTYSKFERAKLHGAVTILIEDGSQMPKTSLGKRAAIEQLRQMNVLDTSQPDTQYAVLRAFGQTDLIPALDYHVKAALKEQDAFERWAATAQMGAEPRIDPMTGQPALDPMTMQPTMQPSVQPPPVDMGFGRKPWHDDQVHWSEHRKWANSDKVGQLLAEKPFLEGYVAALIQEHEMALQAAAAQQAQAQGEPGGAGRALTNSNNESGNEQDVPSGTGQRGDNRGPE